MATAADREPGGAPCPAPAPPTLSDVPLNSTVLDPSDPASDPTFPLPASRALPKTVVRLGLAVTEFFRRFGLNHVLFVTLTLVEASRDLAASNRRLSALLTALRKRVPALDYLWVAGLTARGDIHYHLLVSLPDDVRVGADFSVPHAHPGRDLAAQRAAVNPVTRGFWDLLDRISAPLGFGRTDVFPLRSEPAAIAAYLLKNYRGFQARRQQSDSRHRMWGLSGGAPRPPRPNQFALNHPGSAGHRKRLAAAAARLGLSKLEQAAYVFGSRWHYLLASVAYGEFSPERLERLRRDVRRIGPALPRLAAFRDAGSAPIPGQQSTSSLSADPVGPGRSRPAAHRGGRSRPRAHEAPRAWPIERRGLCHEHGSEN